MMAGKMMITFKPVDDNHSAPPSWAATKVVPELSDEIDVQAPVDAE